MTPRRYFAEQIFGTLIEGGRTDVPVYNDKHLAYRWSDAEWIYETARARGIPLWAASAMPVCWRAPASSPAAASAGEAPAPITEAVVIANHMVERYGYHVCSTPALCALRGLPLTLALRRSGA